MVVRGKEAFDDAVVDALFDAADYQRVIDN
ncbi:hypothetical protein SacazDRAFT_00912 [Saccharomonospora azurea NA-128]|uniref:Uncharacterized protein n=1 Tax=Saccharomonospora azurea NA-128 TaxID=882081 RepID=H8GDL4_9PSEU|nr:hypothetical protein SacazDRAFT_00912 [Saccharomonospora azurea NA-128]